MRHKEKERERKKMWILNDRKEREIESNVTQTSKDRLILRPPQSHEQRFNDKQAN